MEQKSVNDPSCAANLRRLREDAGLTVQEVAAAIGLNNEWVWDLESYDEELYMTISLAALQHLAFLLRTTARQLLLLEDKPSGEPRVAFKDLVAHLREHLRASGQSADAFGDEVGWDLASTLDNPSNVWEWSPDELRDVAAGLRIDWASALPTASDTPPKVGTFVP